MSNRQFKIFLSQNIKSEGGLYLAKSHLFHTALKIVEKILCNANLKCYNRFFFVVIFLIWDAGDRPCWLLRQTIILFQIALFSSWFLKHCALQHLYSSFGSRWSQSYLEYLSSRCLEYIDRSGGPKLSEKNISENTDGRAAAAYSTTICCFQKLASCTTTSSLPLFIILTRNLLVRHLVQTDYREKTIENEAGNSSLLPNCPLPPFEIKICSTHTFLLDTMLYRIIRVKHTVLN